MSTKKVLAIVLAVASLASVNGFAQNSSDPSLEKGSKHGREAKDNGIYLTNKWYDNWSFGIAGGAQIMVGKGNKPLPVTPEFEINITKWVVPAIGVRLGFQGPQVKEYRYVTKTDFNNHFIAKGYPGHGFEGDCLMKWQQLYLHGDILFNISSMFWGYKENRIVSVIPYVNAGFYRLSHPDYNYFNPKDKTTGQYYRDREFALGGGILLNFRITNNWYATLDYRDASISSRYHTFKNEGGNRTNNMSLSVGVTYTIKKWYFEKQNEAVAPVVASYTQAKEALDDIKQANKDLSTQNEALGKEVKNLNDSLDVLRNALAQAKANGTDIDPILARIANADLVFYYDINQSKLTTTEALRLDNYVQTVLDKDSKHVFYITGSADKGTGTEQRNIQLSSSRAEYVKNLLMKKYKISDSQIVIKDPMITDQHKDARFDRCVIMESE